jgi:hypothetical protein
MNQKIECLINGGFVSTNDVLEYAQQYMDGVDQYGLNPCYVGCASRL